MSQAFVYFATDLKTIEYAKFIKILLSFINSISKIFNPIPQNFHSFFHNILIRYYDNL